MQTNRPFAVVICGIVLSAAAMALVSASTPSQPHPALEPIQPRTELVSRRPHVTLDGISHEGGDVVAAFRFVNATRRTIYILAENHDDRLHPRLWYERHHAGRWQIAGWQWCGSGVEPCPVEPGRSLRFSLCLNERSGWVAPYDYTMSLADYRETIRVGLRYREAQDGPDTHIWGTTIPAAMCRPARVDR